MFEEKKDDSAASIMDGPATDFPASKTSPTAGSKKKSVVKGPVSDEEFDNLFKEGK